MRSSAVLLLGLALFGAGCSDNCLRHSDCPDGKSCVAGLCTATDKTPDLAPPPARPADLSLPAVSAPVDAAMSSPADADALAGDAGSGNGAARD